MPVSTVLDGSVAVVTMQWAEKRNSLSAPNGAELAAAIEEAGADSAVTGIVLTGDGAFCSGGDLRYFAEVSRTLPVEEIRRTVYGTMQGIVRALGSVPVPTAAAVDGAAIGLGWDLALACDMRFVGPEGYLQQGWARAGLVPGVGGVGLLARIAPPALFWRLVADQERLGPDLAGELGLADPGVPDARTAAMSRMAALAALGRDLLADHVELSRLSTWPDQVAFDRAADIQAARIGSARFRDLVDRALGARTGSD
jgi:enoyl-CoA hydratase/carnithine racemase